MFIMGRQRREFAPEFKDEAVKLVANTGRTVAQVARELGVLGGDAGAVGQRVQGPPGRR